jgi:hypothetical protein
MNEKSMIDYTKEKILVLLKSKEVTEIDKIYDHLGNQLLMLPEFIHYGRNLENVSNIRYELLKMSMEFRDLTELIKKSKYLENILNLDYENKYNIIYEKKFDDYKLKLIEFLKYIQEQEYIKQNNKISKKN